MRSMNIFIFVLIFGIYNSSVEYSNGRLKKLHMIYYYQYWPPKETTHDLLLSVLAA